MSLSQETPQNRVTRYFSAIQWHFVDPNPGALIEMESRINQAIRQQSQISFSDLVDDISFNLPAQSSGVMRRYRIGAEKWSNRDGIIVGEFLTHLSMQSFIKTQSLVSAVVIKSDGKPSSGFFELARLLGLLDGQSKSTELDFWRIEKNYVYGLESADERMIPFF